MAVAGCINAYDCNGCLIQTLQTLDSACIGVGVQYTAPNPLDDKRLDYIKYTDKCGCTCCLSGENEILIYATDGVIKNLTLTNDDVNEAIKIQWNDIFGSNRAKTIVRYKTGSAPVSITDGTLAVEETTKNQYSSTPFSLTGVLDETTYYFTAFAVDSDNVVINSQSGSITTDFGWHPSANTLLYCEFNDNLNDSSGKGNNATGSVGIGYSTVGGQKVLQIAQRWGGIKFNGSAFSSVGTGDFTICFRAYLVQQGLSGGNPQILGLWSDTDSNNPGPCIFFHRNGANQTLFRMLGGSDSLGEKFYATQQVAVEYNKWHHRAMIRRSGVVYCYIDATLLGSFNSSRTFVPNNPKMNFLGRNESLYGESQPSDSKLGWYNTGAMGDKFIIESGGWPLSDLQAYYNKTKTIYQS